MEVIEEGISDPEPLMSKVQKLKKSEEKKQKPKKRK